MNGMFWNIRGMGRAGRKRCIIDTMVKHDVKFMGIQETKKYEFTDKFLEELAGMKHFCWNCLPSMGSAGGILMGVDSDIFVVEKWVVRKFLISCVVVTKKDVSKCCIATIYGPAYEERKQDFFR
jgi:hypothetical protein